MNAISSELAKGSRYVQFQIDRRWREGEVWSIVVDLSDDRAKGLDESYEGAIAWWRSEPQHGAADVLSVIPERQQINLRFATTAPPAPGGEIRRPIRYESAQRISELVGHLLRSIWEQDILVLTPFRAQRTLIRTLLEGAGHRRVNVSTVHRAQGGERHTVIFDPADGDNNFLRTEDARRLVNVALSRAKARLVVILSPSDRQNPLFEEVATKIEHMDDDAATGVPVEWLTRLGDFPNNAVGRVVIINKRRGEVVEVTAGEASAVQWGREGHYDPEWQVVVNIPEREIVLTGANH